MKHAVRLTTLVSHNKRPKPGQRQREPALRIAGAADETRPSVAAPDDEIRFALLTGAHDLIGSQPILQRLSNSVVV